MEEFVSELSKHLENGLIIDNQIVRITVRSFCCDAPGCDKYLVKGDYINHRMTFCTLNEELLKIGLISRYPADYMHSVCFTVIKKYYSFGEILDEDMA